MGKIKRTLLHGTFAVALAATFLTGCATSHDAVTSAAKLDKSRPGLAETRDIAEQAYIYGFPMIAAYKAMYQFNLNRDSGQYKAGFNLIWNDLHVSTPQDNSVVTPNGDTPYSLLQADLRAEPIVLFVPEVEPGRYYSVQLCDLYACNYGYIGSRATGNGAGCYLVAGPDWKGDVPVGVKKVFRCETQFGLIIYRTQLFGPDDLVNVKKVQAGYAVQTLSQFLKQPAPPAPPAIIWLPFTDEAFKTDFAKYLDFLLQFCPAVPQEIETRLKFAGIGIGSGKKFKYKQLDFEHKVEVGLGVKDGYAKIEQQRDNIAKSINGWRVGAAFGDRSFYDGNYLLRAGAALAGLYGNSAAEAIYPLTKTLADGETLDGSKHNYTLTFPAGQLPPVNAFWSVTMYGSNTQSLVENPINRYLINSRMLSDLKKNADGSITIYLQKNSPGSDKESNWLPAPDGPLYLVLRLYWPKQEAPSILPPGEGTWQPPGVMPVN